MPTYLLDGETWERYLLDGETWEQAYRRRLAEEAAEYTTLCWRCNHAYLKYTTPCPHCAAINANIDTIGAAEQSFVESKG